MQGRTLILLIFSTNVCATVFPKRNKVLFPSAQRLKRHDRAIPVNTGFHHSEEEMQLLYEFLLGGFNIDDNFHCSLKDKELASMRAAKKFNTIFNDIIPKNITEIRRLTDRISRNTGELKPEDFERIVLTLVYTSYQALRFQGHQKDTWVESLVNIFQILKQDLTMK
ncbi:protein FAM180A [Callorhinchus milii]|uniref:Family with sequence similarity 180 member A n=1 Tax=Callorhinchus milii TaxID=7868 RepID=A0A4W3K8H7_CALMI|nr:protein FAM180A [Callorhinchus milii]|eukprot:gi/632961389/ref/XP_007896730.1/ PREDICTED: protein FAM180A [Callorhinchus milii]